jgi:Domain of unknown function (DUF4190)
VAESEVLAAVVVVVVEFGVPGGEDGAVHSDPLANFGATVPTVAGDAGQPTRPPFNSLAIVSAVLAILWIFCIGSLLGVVLGKVAERQIRRSDERGDALAGVGIVVGSLGLLMGSLYVLWRVTGWPPVEGD